MNKALLAAKLVIYEEMRALEALGDNLDWSMFSEWVEDIVLTDSKVVVTGVGKSAIAARKIAATLATSGVQAVFLDPVGMFHGELGLLRPGDMVIAVSRSGETEELVRLETPLKVKGIEFLPLVGVKNSVLGSKRWALSTGIDTDPGQGVPTASSAAAVAVGDALAAAIAERIENRLEENHPGGALGLKLKSPAEKLAEVHAASVAERIKS